MLPRTEDFNLADSRFGDFVEERHRHPVLDKT
jgi:hypothetical protein